MLQEARYPTWGDIASLRAMFRSIPQSTLQDVVCPFLVEHGSRVIPAMIVQYASTTVRKEISHDTPAKILMDVVTVLPFPTPIAYIMAVIFNDLNNPLWAQVCLSLLPIRSPEDAKPERIAVNQALRGQRFVRAFCQSNPECGLLALDHRQKILTRQIVPFESLPSERLAEIAEVMDFLDRFDIDRSLDDVLVPVQKFKQLACFAVKNPVGRPVIIPRGRSLRFAAANIFSIKVAHGRLFDRHAVQSFSTEQPPKYDLFISHAHLDSKSAQKIAAWLRKVWPQLRIAVTRPEDEQTFQKHPTYFLDDSRASRCILYLATLNSINRPMVDTEIGGNADKPIVSLLLGGLTLDDLNEKLKRNLFLAVDVEKAVAPESAGEWHKLVELLATELGLPNPTSTPPPPGLEITPADESSGGDLIGSYVEDNLFIKQKVCEQQTVGQADLLLTDIISKGHDERTPGEVTELLTLSPFQKLIVLMLSQDDETEWVNILESFPALLNERLVAELVGFELLALIQRELDARKLRRISNLTTGILKERERFQGL